MWGWLTFELGLETGLCCVIEGERVGSENPE